MAGWVTYSIKTTKRLHKLHNIFVANLMAADMVMALHVRLLSTRLPQ